MTTLQLNGTGHGGYGGYGYGDGSGFGTGWEGGDGDGGGYGNGYGESRGEGYGTGYRRYAFGDTGDGGLLLRSPEPIYDILATDDALEALTFL
jgi:hypothetical protein